MLQQESETIAHELQAYTQVHDVQPVELEDLHVEERCTYDGAWCYALRSPPSKHAPIAKPLGLPWS